MRQHTPKKKTSPHVPDGTMDVYAFDQACGLFQDTDEACDEARGEERDEGGDAALFENASVGGNVPDDDEKDPPVLTDGGDDDERDEHPGDGRRVWTFDARLLATIAALAPATHEITIAFDRAKDGTLRVRAHDGNACPLDGACAAAPCHSGACAHTHPFGNRPSSADMVKAIVDPRRAISFVLAPRGVFAYAATPRGRALWRELSREDARRLRTTWKLLGFFLQEETQNGDVERYLTLMRDAGFVAEYVAYEDLAQYSHLRFVEGAGGEA